METMAYMLDTAEVEGKTVFRYLHMPAHQHLCAVKTLCYRAALLLSHALLAADFAESTLRLAYQESNKPYFENERNLHFSLSYSYQHAMCAISDEPIGYDVQLATADTGIVPVKWVRLASNAKATDEPLSALLANTSSIQPRLRVHRHRAPR